ncbi:transposase [Streptomyces sp. NBC_01618]|uniref:transposase n=1 Tax=Streptomyces sp. NBC_01618 TaxID=2975900 RepID=UPI00386FCDDA|nr:transposase [Streptomyces sp. NBC_01618]
MPLQPKGLPEIPEGLPEIPAQTVAVARAAFPYGTLAMRARDRLGEVSADEPFTEAFGRRGAPGLPPAVLQFTENLTDRRAAAMAVRAIDWKYAIDAELTDTGFDATVLPRFLTRLAEHGLERVVFDRFLDLCRKEGLVGADGKRRTDFIHVISAVRDLNRTELAGESVRAALEALAVAAPGRLAGAVDIPELAHRRAPSTRPSTRAANRRET